MFKNTKELIFIAGPCVIESKKSVLEIAAFLKDLLEPYPIQLIFKASFDKANRTSVHSYRGPGIIKGLDILEAVKNKFGLPILSDVHCVEQIDVLKDVLDIIQIPAFLSRQTDLIIQAAKTKKTINIKKAQFMSPADIKYVVEKVESTSNKNILLTERGSCFGYNNLVVDFRSFLEMKKLGYPVIYDVTHSLQRPSAKGGISGGDREFVEPLGLAAVATGVDGLFMEVHPNPKLALSDKHTSYPLSKLKVMIEKVVKIRKVLNEKDKT
ncbi:MAG: 3-deoxy-8-phosphooctulonate synthase [Candidatus Omnitrophica bacterium]|nr:3-deoxy-8-phosphooctulonate synthase [Candidatus Omnitrophota bacterium]